MAAVVQVWSAPACEAGAQCLGSLPWWVSAQGSEAAGTPASLRIVIPRELADANGVAEGRCLRVLSQTRGEQWWYLSQVSDSDGDQALVSLTAGPMRQLLTVRGVVRSGATTTFEPGARTISALLSTYVLTNLSADGLSWISLGTIDSDDTIDIGSIARATRNSVLDAIEQQTGYSARLRGVYTSGVLTGFALDVLVNPAASADIVLLSGPAIESIQRTRDALRAATVAVPFSTSGQPMAETVWLIDSVSGTTPAWLLLRDPTTANPWPVQEDDQLNGYYVQLRDGTQAQITDSRASDSAVQIATVGSFTAGKEVTIVANTAGDPLIELSSPAGLASSRGRLVSTVSTTVADSRRNYVSNGALTSWTNATTPRFFGTATNAIDQYFRISPSGANLTLQVDGNVSAGATSIPFRGAPANAQFYQYEAWSVTGVQSGWLSQRLTADSSGRGSFTATAITAIADGTTITMHLDSGGGTGVFRPLNIPTEAGGGDVARITAQFVSGGRLVSPASLIRAGAGAPVQVNAAAGITVRADTDAGYLSGNRFPTLRVVNDGTSASLAFQDSGAQQANQTAHYVLSCSATLTANTSVFARVEGGNTTNKGFVQWQGVRWLSLWLGTGSAMGLQGAPASNQLWHRANQVLANYADGARYVVKGVDLDRLRTDNGALQLGQRVRLRSDLLQLDATVKIVKLDYDLSGPEVLNLELGAIQPRLTGVTVSL
jgi:hypothetical protein